MLGSLRRESFTLGRTSDLPSNTRGRSRMRECCTYGSARGALSNGRSYRDHRIGVAWVVLRGALQHGHRARVVARATIRCRRIVAIEFATCRSGRTGGASGWTILGNAKRRELIGGVVGG